MLVLHRHICGGPQCMCVDTFHHTYARTGHWVVASLPGLHVHGGILQSNDALGLQQIAKALFHRLFN